MPDVVGFSPKNAARVARATQQIERQYRFPVANDKGYRPGWTGTRIAKATSGIPAMAGTTPGNATITLYTFDGTHLVSREDVTAYNAFTTAVGSGHWIQVTLIDGFWFVSAEDCG